MNYAKILGTGSYLPEKRLANADLDPALNTSDEWIFDRTGIKARRIASEKETVSTMAAEASKRAIEAAELTVQDIDMIIVATCSQENFFPSSACLLQSHLGITAPIPAFDVSAACAGFIYALVTAEQFIKSGAVKTALVVGSETMSRTVDWTDRKTCVLFGDGAGAIVLQASNEPGILCSKLHAQGSYKDLLILPNEMTSPHLDSKFMQMKGNEVFKIAVRSLEEVVEEILEEHKIAKDDIQWLVPHQANFRIIAAMAKKLDMDLERVILTIGEHGNTSSASIPLALDVGVRDGRIRRGDHLLLESFGGGLAWGAALIQY
jgi:3-oxoacyl-[acyl-carrier-protein] synthase-3